MATGLNSYLNLTPEWRNINNGPPSTLENWFATQIVCLSSQRVLLYCHIVNYDLFCVLAVQGTKMSSILANAQNNNYHAQYIVL